MRKVGPLFGVAVIATLVGFGIGFVVAGSKSAVQIDRLVAMNWGDGKYGAGFYGAHVYLEPIASGYSVRARVSMGRGNGYFHDCGELGRVVTDDEAVARWGRVEWREDGLHIGTGTNHYFLARTQIESHR